MDLTREELKTLRESKTISNRQFYSMMSNIASESEPMSSDLQESKQMDSLVKAIKDIGVELARAPSIQMPAMEMPDHSPLINKLIGSIDKLSLIVDRGNQQRQEARELVAVYQDGKIQKMVLTKGKV